VSREFNERMKKRFLGELGIEIANPMPRVLTQQRCSAASGSRGAVLRPECHV
jgi:hypothetical protein